MENRLNATDNLAAYKAFFEDARDANDDYRKECLIDRDYFDGHQITDDERRVLEARKQPVLFFNEVKIAIRGLIGVWDQGEVDPRAWPRTPQDEDSADVATKALRYVKDTTDWSNLRTYCALNYFIEGTCAAFVGVRQTGRPKIEQIRFEEFFHDPRSRSLDFSDARYVGIAKWMFATDVAARYPEQGEAIASAFDAAAGMATGGDTFSDRPDGQIAQWIDGKLRRVFVVEMYHREDKFWQRCEFWGRGVLSAGPSPYVDNDGKPTSPICARSCYIDRDNRRYGEVRDLRSPQDAINKRESKLLHLVNNRQVRATDPASAMAADVDLVRAEAAKPDGVIPIGWDTVTTSDMASGQVLLLDSARNFMQRIGQNPGVLASQSASASGRAQIARQQAGMTDSAMTLNGLRRFELSVFRAGWERCRQFWKQEDWIRVTDDTKAAKFVGINQPVYGEPQPMLGPDGQVGIGRPVLGYKNALAELDVDITIESVPNTANLAMEQFETLASLAQSGVPIPPMALIEASALPNKREILEKMQGGEPDPAQQAQQELQMRGAAAGVARIEAEAALTGAKAENERLRSYTEGMRAGSQEIRAAAV